jgi:hypothetical protein
MRWYGSAALKMLVSTIRSDLDLRCHVRAHRIVSLVFFVDPASVLAQAAVGLRIRIARRCG